MLAEDIAKFLAAEGVGTLGATVFFSDMPPKVDTGVMVEDLSGESPGYVHDSNAPLYRSLRFQVFSRAPSYEAAHAKAAEVYTALIKLHAGAELNGATYYSVIPTSDPYKFSVDAQTRVIFHQEFIVRSNK